MSFGLLSLKSFKLSTEVKKIPAIQAKSKQESKGIYENETGICGTYVNDLNLIELNSMVINRIVNKMKTSEKLFTDQLVVEREKLKNPQSRIERGYTIRLIQAKEKELESIKKKEVLNGYICLLYTSPSPRD